MVGADSYIAVIVTAMFVTGVILAILKVRQRSRTRKQWKDGQPNPIRRY
jgi:hypothetical protein